MNEDYEESLRRLQESNARRRDQYMQPREWPPAGTIAKDWEAHGLRCTVVRGPVALCGYVLLPADHQHANDHYDKPEVSVHGGLTFHQRDLSGGMWFGFDVGHCFDWVEMPEAGVLMPGTIWTVEEVAAECEQLAEQFASMTKQGEMA